MDEKAKKQALLMIPYGLFVLGAAHGGKETAATVNWVTQASFNPPLVVVGIKGDSSAHAIVKDSKTFALSMLASQPPAEPATGVLLHHLPGCRDIADSEVVRPAHHQLVELDDLLLLVPPHR